jgi:hypothetical protein
MKMHQLCDIKLITMTNTYNIAGTDGSVKIPVNYFKNSSPS